jgi:aspartokinase
MIVMKFGGSSVADARRIRDMVDIVRRYIPRRPVLALSAMGDADYLLEAADTALKTEVVSALSACDSSSASMYRWFPKAQAR